MNSDLYHSVQQFLYEEAHILDERRYRDWLNLLTDDVTYVMPSRYTRLREGPDEQWQVDKELDDLPHFDEDLASLTIRVERLYTGMAWTEEPPSRTRHLVTNIRIKEGETPNEVQAFSYFLAFRSRLEGLKADENFFFGERRDTLRWVEGEWKLAKRFILTDAVVINAQNISIFF
jgi:3-phenylpropionate/cinnamic acid dioxygenase small subunit